MTDAQITMAEVVTSTDDVTYWAYDDRIALRYSGMENTRGGDVKAQVEIRWNEKPHEGIVKHGWMALGGTAGAWVRELAKLRPELTEAQWGQIINRSSYLAKRRFQTGDPFEFIGDEPKPSKYVIRPLVVDSGPTVISAEGGSTKSFLALAIALTVATGSTRFLGIRPSIVGPVLYLDWEDVKNTQDERARALCRAVDIDVPRDRLIYSRQNAPLPATLDPLLRKIADLPERPVLAVIDSVGKARGGDVNSAQDTNALFGALDKLGLPTVCIDHKSKEAIQRKLKGPIGSVYSWNSARIAWDIEKSQLIGSDSIQIVARNVKANGSRLHRSHAWQVEFDNQGSGDAERLEGVRYKPIDPLAVTRVDFESASILERVESLLASSDTPLTVKAIGEALDHSVDSLRRTLNRHPDRVINVSNTGEGLWTLPLRDDQVKIF